MTSECKIYSNKKPDFILSAFEVHSAPPKQVQLATPFFTYAPVIEKLVGNGCSVQLIVRLCEITSPDALKKIMKHRSVQVRFFTSQSFHSKLYIFGSTAALVGSANLTQSGIMRNQEICVEVSGGTDAFDSLVSVFQSYWDEAHVLTDSGLEAFRRARSENQTPSSRNLEDALLASFGDVSPSGIRVSSEKATKDKLFIHEYSKTYQDFLSKYEVLRSIYKEDGRRKISAHEVPLRIEIDQFLSFVREKHAPGESYSVEELLSGNALRSKIDYYLELWHEIDWPYLHTDIPAGLVTIGRAFESPETIQSASVEEIFDALTVCHSFRNRQRFFKGGLTAFKGIFVAKNDASHVKSLISHLLFGKGDFVERMADCIYDPNYKIKEFGKSAVQELFGWVNFEDIPICNSRTVKAMRFLGIDVEVFE